MPTNHQTSVIIAGAGPVGMSLAIDLAMRGLDVAILEQRTAGTPPSSKCNTVASRSLEAFRRFGVAEAIRASGLPDDFPTDWLMTLAMRGPELGRLRMPSRLERAMPGFPDSGWATPEPVVRTSQIYLEPILSRRMRELPEIKVLDGTRLVSFDQNSHGVLVSAIRDEDGSEVLVGGRFLVGCDGGRSVVRKALGIQLVGDDELLRSRSTLIRSADVLGLFGEGGPAWMTYITGRYNGVVIAINGTDLWLVHRFITGEFESVDLDGSLREVLGVGPEFPYEIVNHEDWVGRRLVAERFRDGNVFIAGDAAHLWVPFAGYGMNAGIADALNLSPKLAAVLQGWGGDEMLAAYEAERQPITDQVSQFAAEMSRKSRAGTQAEELPSTIADATPEAARLRAEIGAAAVRRNTPQFAPAGLNFGYFYDASPIITYDGEAPPDYSMGDATPSTVPGCRFPHFWVSEAVSIYDLFGPDYTLVRFDPTVDVGPLAAAAAARWVPLTVVDVQKPIDHPAFRHRLVIVRQDQQVAWRGDSSPADPSALIERLRGAIAGIGTHMIAAMADAEPRDSTIVGADQRDGESHDDR